MLDELRLSSEPKYLVEAAMKYLRGLKGHLVRDKKVARQRALGSVPSGVGAAVNGGAENGVVNGGGGVMQNGGTQVNGSAQVNGGAWIDGGQAGPVEGSAEWAQLPIEDRLQALAGFQGMN
jgi:hypothetical protein